MLPLLLLLLPLLCLSLIWLWAFFSFHPHTFHRYPPLISFSVTRSTNRFLLFVCSRTHKMSMATTAKQWRRNIFRFISCNAVQMHRLWVKHIELSALYSLSCLYCHSISLYFRLLRCSCSFRCSEYMCVCVCLTRARLLFLFSHLSLYVTLIFYIREIYFCYWCIRLNALSHSSIHVHVCLCHFFHLFHSCFCHIFHYQRNTNHV